MKKCIDCEKNKKNQGETCPTCAKRKSNKIILFIIIGIVIVVAAFMNGDKDIKIKGNSNTANSINKTNNESNKPKIEVTIIDFSKMLAAEIKTWCVDNSITYNEKYTYSNEIAKDLFLTQSVLAGNKINENSTLTITYSLGKEPTLSQKNAVKKAEQYLKTMAFSRTGLIKQLEFEEYSKTDATYAVDNIVVDWLIQSEKKAQQYLNTMAFSRTGLIKQLEFEGFTKAQATHGVNKVGL